MKFLQATIQVEVPDDTAMILLNPIQQLTGRIVKTGATAEGLPDTRESIPASVTPIVFTVSNYEVGRLKDTAQSNDAADIGKSCHPPRRR